MKMHSATTRSLARAIAALGLAAGVVVALVDPPNATTARTTKTSKRGNAMAAHPYVGMWVTLDGRIRHELLPNGRYDEARGDRKSAYQGRYEVRGNHIDDWDDTGFTADGTFVSDDELHHGGMIFRRDLGLRSRQFASPLSSRQRGRTWNASIVSSVNADAEHCRVHLCWVRMSEKTRSLHRCLSDA